MNIKYIEKLKKRKIAILGFGIEGKALVDFFTANSIEDVTIFDIKDIENQTNLKFTKVSTYEAESLSHYDLVFISPGISPYNHKLLNLNLSSLTNLWFDLFPNAKVIGVTGTKGKSSTASLIYHTLKSLNKTVALAGNIGIPLLEIENPENQDFIILELSSYQLFNFKHYIDSACFLNLYEEHLSWHEGFENYKKDKLNLCRNVKKFLVVNYESKDLFQNFKHKPDYFNLKNDNNKLPLDYSKECVKTLLQLYKFDKNEIDKSIKTFKGLKHRLNVIKELNINIQVIDDSLSTIPESTIKACMANREKDIYLILGGKDRGINYVKIAMLPTNVKKVFCFDEAGERMYSILKERALFFNGFKEAILSSVENATPNSIILFSPAAPSNAPFNNYKERSNYLAKVIDSL